MQGVVIFLFIFLTFAKLEIVRSEIVSVHSNDDDNYEVCSDDKNSNRRIGGGNFADLGQFPYQAGLYILNGKIQVCGGSLFSSTRIITAAHCWDSSDGIAKGAIVTLGSLHLNHGGIRILTDKFVIHPEWDPVNLKNDVAVVYLPHPVTFSSTIAPISLPSESELGEDFVHFKAVVPGYSANEKTNCTKPLSYAFFEIITNSECKMRLGHVSETTICAKGFGSGTNTCKGDSGGPLAVIKNNRPILVGVVSFGAACPADAPEAFTRITAVMPFIKQHL